MILQQQTCLNTAACPKILAWVEANLNDTHTLLYFLFIHMREKWKQLLGNSTVVTCQQIARFLIEKVTFYLFPYVYEDTVKSSRPSLCETRDKRPLGRDPDKSLSHRHTSVKLSWSQPMDPWTIYLALTYWYMHYYLLKRDFNRKYPILKSYTVVSVKSHYLWS